MSVKVPVFDLTFNGLPVFTQALKITILETLTEEPGPLFECKLNLFVNDLTPNPDSVIADFTVPTWAGYGANTLTNNPVTGAGTYGATMEYNSVDWESAAAADATVYGCFITNEGGTVLFGYARFDEPIPVAGVQTISVLPVLLIE